MSESATELVGWNGGVVVAAELAAEEVVVTALVDTEWLECPPRTAISRPTAMPPSAITSTAAKIVAAWKPRGSDDGGPGGGGYCPPPVGGCHPPRPGPGAGGGIHGSGWLPALISPRSARVPCTCIAVSPSGGFGP